MRVEVYWNLHKHLFSVRALEGEYRGRVIDHSYGVRLSNATFVSQPAGRERVRREGKKNVHAFVRGHLEFYDTTPWFGGWSTISAHRTNVTYNPYKYDSFVEADTEKPIHKADMVLMDVMLGRGKPFPRISVLTTTVNDVKL